MNKSVVSTACSEALKEGENLLPSGNQDPDSSVFQPIASTLVLNELLWLLHRVFKYNKNK